MTETNQDKIKKALSLSDSISDIISGQVNTETQHTVDAWLAENEQNKDLFDKICSDNTIREKLHNYKNSDAEQAFDRFQNTRKQKSRRRILYRVLSGVAVVAICFGIWTLSGIKKQESQVLLTAKAKQESSNMAADKPVLTLGNGTQMNVWGDGLHFTETEKGQKIMLKDSLLSQQEDTTASSSYNTLNVPSMCDFSFTMSDGTKVWMNANSTLKYPTKFAADSRTISASGEIYLEVAKDSARPFYVVIDGITIKVLGTSFNVRAYDNENDTKITLLEGKIAAQTDNKEYTLTPGKQLKRGKTFGSIGILTVNPEDVISWTKGYYVFKKSRLQEVASTLQHWYGVTIMMTSEVSNSTTYTGVVNKEEELEVFLRRLEEVSSVKCSRNGKVVTIY